MLSEISDATLNVKENFERKNDALEMTCTIDSVKYEKEFTCIHSGDNIFSRGDNMSVGMCVLWGVGVRVSLCMCRNISSHQAYQISRIYAQ